MVNDENLAGLNFIEILNERNKNIVMRNVIASKALLVVFSLNRDVFLYK